MEESGRLLAEVFDRERARFLGFVRRQISGFSGMDAEDVVAEVSYKLLRRADLMAEVENLTAYIYRSLANRIAEYRRGGVATVSLDHHGALDSQTLPPLDPGHGGLNPEQHYHQTELREQLRAAIGQLGPQERAVWVATEMDGLTFRELAEAWDEPIGTLLSRKSRATAKMRHLLSQNGIQP